MRICTGLTRTELTLFSRLGATGGAAKRQNSFLFGCHDYNPAPLLGKKLCDCDQIHIRTGFLSFYFAVNGEFVVASIAGTAGNR